MTNAKAQLRKAVSYSPHADNVGFLHSELPLCRTSLLRLARSLTRDREEAEDLVQDTLFLAYRRAETFRGLFTREAVSRWLSAIMRNHFYNLCARKKRMRTSDAISFDEELWHPHRRRTDNDPARSCEEQLRIVALMNAVECLPLPQREVLRLAAFEQLAYDEIGEHLYLPVGTVRSRLHRARLRLARATVTWHEPKPFFPSEERKHDAV